MSEKQIDYCEVPTKEISNNLDTDTPSRYGYGVRHVQFIIFFFSIGITYVARGHLGVTIVAMTHIPDKNISNEILNATNKFDGNVTFDKYNISNGGEVFQDGEENKTKSKHEVYEWDKKTQEMVLGSFFTGYSVGMVPFGILSQRFGAKMPLQFSLLINGILSIITPWCITLGGWKAICGCRFLQGISQSGTFPGIQLLISAWSPLPERALLSSFLHSGTIFGTVLAFQVGGLLANSPWGWPSSFWSIGAVCLVFFVIVSIFAAASPNEHKTISEEERNYILGNLRNVKRSKKVPWKAIITSKPIWATFIANITSGSVFVFLLTQVASYIHYILGVNVENSGLLTSLPYIGSLFSSMIFGFLSDYCTNRNLVSVKNARKLINSFSQFGVAITLLLVTVAPSTIWAVTCFVLTVSCHMGVHSGWMLNQIDLAPNYTGIVMTIGNLLGALVTQLIPILTSNIVVDVRDIVQWRVVFIVVAIWAALGNIIFSILMSPEKQPWNEYADVAQDEENTKDEKVQDVKDN